MPGIPDRAFTASTSSGWESLSGVPADLPLTFDLDGRGCTLIASTAELLTWWARANWYGLVARAVPDLDGRLLDPHDAFDLPDAALLAQGLTRTLTGLGWPEVVHLSASVVADWAGFEAWAAVNAHGLDLLHAPPRRTLAAAFAMFASGCEEPRDLEELRRELADPRRVPGIVTERDADGRRAAPWSKAEEAAEFLAMASAFGAPVPTSGQG